MAASAYDLWLASGRAYQAVPYDVVANWLQQGRLGAADRVRPTGTTEWKAVVAEPALAAYLPRATVPLPQDAAEALQPLDLGIAVSHRRVDEDDDVDMIPLIDISLVLLIFFIMTSAVAVGGSRVNVPETAYATLTSGKDMLWVAIDLENGGPVYSFGIGEKMPESRDERISADEVIERVRRHLRDREAGQVVVVRVAAHHRTPIETVQRMTARLTELKRDGLAAIKAEVQERPQ